MQIMKVPIKFMKTAFQISGSHLTFSEYYKSEYY
jgi:hypothetical protein